MSAGWVGGGGGVCSVNPRARPSFQRGAGAGGRAPVARPLFWPTPGPRPPHTQSSSSGGGGGAARGAGRARGGAHPKHKRKSMPPFPPSLTIVHVLVGRALAEALQKRPVVLSSRRAGEAGRVGGHLGARSANEQKKRARARARCAGGVWQPGAVNPAERQSPAALVGSRTVRGGSDGALGRPCRGGEGGARGGAEAMRAQGVVEKRRGRRCVPGATVPRGGEKCGGRTRAGVCGGGCKSGDR